MMAFWQIQRNSIQDQFFLPFKMKMDESFACTEFFFDFINAKILPDFIGALANMHGYNNNSFAAVYFPSDMDGMDIANGLAISKGFLRISDRLAEKTELMEEKIFYRIAIDYAESMIEFYGISSEFGESWRKGILDDLTKIKHRLNSIPDL
jgi:hypothetical protein